jgi:hypothetical protein
MEDPVITTSKHPRDEELSTTNKRQKQEPEPEQAKQVVHEENQTEEQQKQEDLQSDFDYTITLLGTCKSDLIFSKDTSNHNNVDMDKTEFKKLLRIHPIKSVLFPSDKEVDDLEWKIIRNENDPTFLIQAKQEESPQYFFVYYPFGLDEKPLRNVFLFEVRKGTTDAVPLDIKTVSQLDPCFTITADGMRTQMFCLK